MLIRSVLFNFQGAFLNSVVLISQTTLLLYHIFSSLSRGFSNFFQSFLNFLVELSRSDFLFESLFIISHSLEFVKRFSKLFSRFFELFCDFLSFRALISDGLYIISPFSSKVNPFFANFFIFFGYVTYMHNIQLYRNLLQQFNHNTALAICFSPFNRCFSTNN